MHEDNLNTQIPIFRFLNKHKWRIVLPFLFTLFYFVLPRYLTEYVAVQQYVFYKSAVLSKAEINKEFSDIREQILSDESLKNFIYKYDLFKAERDKNTAENLLVEKLRSVLEDNIRLDDEAANQSLAIWVVFRKENAGDIGGFSREITSRFEQNPNIHIDKYVSEPYDANPYKYYVFFGGLLWGLIMISIPLILLWELPNMFYSAKTKETVFEPLKTDWENELLDAKLRNQTWKAMQINIRYSYAFLAAMLQKSPVGDLVEFVTRTARQ